MARRSKRRTARDPAPGFTLIELLIVMVIIGIIIAFVLSAAMGSIRQAELRGTQGLIAKLETGMTDRIEALLGQRADANTAHAYLARLWLGTGSPIDQPQRAQTIAQFDRMKAELPDVFVVQAANTDYPLNFAAGAYTGNTANIAPSLAVHAAYFLPLGVGIDDNLSSGSAGANLPSGALPETTGVYGASYSAAAGLYKQLALAASAAGAVAPTPPTAGYDLVDNNQNGLIDELGENGGLASNMMTLLGNHTHKTARSEMLYALLVEGQGPLGSVFSRDDFNDSEVRDTDGDGLLEFVDAWGEPLQFYRWPVSYSSDVQRGAGIYNGTFDTREQNPLDPNQQLMNPAWWSGTLFNTGGPWPVAVPLSGGAATFQRLFFPLTDPNANPSAGPVFGNVWDRGPTTSVSFGRRAYYSRFLILSGGPDKTPGVPVLDLTYYNNLAQYTASGTATGPVFPGGTILNLLIECQAAQASPLRSDPVWLSVSPGDPLTAAIIEAGNDDVTSHNLQAAGGATQ